MILVAAADDPVDEKEPEKFAKVKPKGELFFLITFNSAHLQSDIFINDLLLCVLL